MSCAQLSDIQKTSIIVLGKKRYLSEESFAKGFLHEFGHALGLREESMGYQKFPLPGYPNCATTREDAVSWWGDLAEHNDRVTYFAGCSGNKDYLRPTSVSLMNDPDKAEDFGPVNERYLRQQLERNF